MTVGPVKYTQCVRECVSKIEYVKNVSELKFGKFRSLKCLRAGFLLAMMEKWGCKRLRTLTILN